MIRLGAFLLALILGIVVILGAFGSGGPERSRVEAAAEPRRAAQDPEAPALIPSLTTPEPQSSPGPIVQAEAQTAPQVQRFPGPPLRPSPEHGDRTPEAAPALPADATGPIYYVTGDRVNFRSGPSTGDGVVGALDRGSPVEIIGPTDGEWVQLRDARGRQGYMSSRFISQQP